MLDYPDIKAILLQPIVAKLIGVGFGLLLILQLISGVIDFYSITTRTSIQNKLPILKNTQKDEKKSSNELAMPLFGAYVPKSLKDLSIKQSDLNLKLVGILFSKTEADSQVIIQSLGEREQTYKIGNTIPGGAVIKRITVDGMLIERKGVLESLSLPKNELIFAPPAKMLREE